MITSKTELEKYLQKDMKFFNKLSQKEKMLCAFTNDPLYHITKYVRLLRKEEYYYNCRKDKAGKLLALWYSRRKNILGNKLGFKIPINTFREGLTIYHHGEVIVNEDVKVGKNAVLHGGNCIGNNGSKGSRVPIIGDNLDLGIGAKVVGDIKLGNNVTVGANAVVTHSYLNDNVTLVGIPARELKRR